MKKLLCIVFVLSLLLSNVYAAGGYDLTQATLDAKSKIEIPAECTEFSSSVQSEDGITVFWLTWTTPEDSEDYQSVEVQMSDRGDLLNFYSYDREEKGKTGIADLSRDELVAMAKAWADKVNPSWSAQLDAESASVYTSVYDSGLQTTFTRKIGEYEVYGNYFSVTVDKFTGKVTNAYSSWTYTEKEPVAGIPLEIAAAQEKFAENMGMELSYVQKPDTKTAVLVYMPKNADLWIDAQTGEVAVPKDRYSFATNSSASMKEMAVAEDAAADRVSLTPAEIEEISQMESLISKEEVAAFIKSLENTPFKDAVISSVSYNVYKEKDAADKYTVTATVTDAEGRRIGSVRLDAESGILLALDYYSYNEQKGEKLDAKVTQKTADSFKEKYAADIKDQVKIFGENDGTSYLYERSVNDIRFGGHYVRVGIDPYTGEVISFARNYADDLTFDDPAGIIDTAVATEALFTQNPLKLMYADLSDKTVSDDFRLVYAKSGTCTTIDAKTGKLLSGDLTEYTGEEEATLMPEDLDGHWAKDMVISLIENGVIEGKASFNPNGTLTQRQALELVCALTGMYLPRPLEETELYTRVINRDILDKEEKNPEMIVTRQEAVKYIIRALGYRDVAELDGIYNCGFSDRDKITAGYEGYVALAKGLSVVSGDSDGNFNPQNSVTRAEFAAMMYKYLTR